MRSVLTISSAASSRALLTIEELRVAAGLASDDGSRDADLERVGLQASDAISLHCRVRGDGLTPPTLLRETLVETFRPRDGSFDPLILGRRFLGTVSVVEDDVTLTDAQFAIDPGAGMLTRLTDEDDPRYWCASKIIVTYQAGFVDIPEPLKQAAAALVRYALSMSARDPLLKDETVDGVGRWTYWVGPVEGGAVPRDVADLLVPYRTKAV